jgi:hypothetical protein
MSVQRETLAGINDCEIERCSLHVYTSTITGVGGNGNPTSKSVVVSVPRSQSQSDQR